MIFISDGGRAAPYDMVSSLTFSIITPTLNAAATIEKVLQSVSEQSYKRIEHIIVDGGSTDSTSEIVSRYSSRLRHIRFLQEKDRGIYDAMNRGILASSGDYLLFLGSDDVFHDQEVLTDLVVMHVFDTNKVVYGNVLVVGDTGWAKDGNLYDGPFSKEKLLRKNICHQAIFYPREIFSRLGFFNIRYVINADWDMNLRCWADEGFSYVDRIITTFNAGGRSTSVDDEAFKNDYLMQLKLYFNFTPEELIRLGKKSPWGNLNCNVQIPPVRIAIDLARKIARFPARFIKKALKSF